MSYDLRDRSDGQVEIILSRPILVGVFPERETAERICAFLRADQPELPDDCPESFVRAMRDVHVATDADLDEIASTASAKPNVMAEKSARLPALRKPAKAPAVVDKPRMAAQISQSSYWPMSLEDTQTALARIQNGEKIVDVAKDYPVSMMQLRAKWANWKRSLQKHIAEAGPQPCKLCAREFVPSISNPDTCARCSK